MTKKVEIYFWDKENVLKYVSFSKNNFLWQNHIKKQT